METYRKIGLFFNNGYYYTLFIMIAIGFIGLVFFTLTKNSLFILITGCLTLLHFYFTPIIFRFIHSLSIKKQYGNIGKQYLLNHFSKLKYGDSPNINFERDL